MAHFSTYDASRPGRPKTVTTKEIIDQIHELILQDCRFLAKSIAEQLGISHERVGSIIHEDLDMRKVSAKWVPKYLNADQKRQRWHSSEQIWNFFGAIQMISCRDWWPWTNPGYITMTRRQSNNQGSGGIAVHSAPQKIPSAKVRWKSFLLDLLGSRRHPPHWLSSKRQNCQLGVLLISAGAIEGHFERKTPWESHQGCLVLARQFPASRGTCKPEETGLCGLSMSWSPTLFSGSVPSYYHLFPGVRTQLKRRHFSSDAEVIAAAETWLDGNLLNIFFWVACKSWSNGLRSELSFVGSMLTFWGRNYFFNFSKPCI